ncbi:hypothetical protein O181_021147 [Austropuccinia psidii MF-1]|uniref:Uncharacterized protein n=1 Tax=Austropuccinia psidii MF-1 TaxID=1389203 RepID=A0A9Q3CD17_9BASI|nr:hypothetical protein [Austropuccinia psidii MF-1]
MVIKYLRLDWLFQVIKGLETTIRVWNSPLLSHSNLIYSFQPAERIKTSGTFEKGLHVTWTKTFQVSLVNSYANFSSLSEGAAGVSLTENLLKSSKTFSSSTALAQLGTRHGLILLFGPKSSPLMTQPKSDFPVKAISVVQKGKWSLGQTKSKYDIPAYLRRYWRTNSDRNAKRPTCESCNEYQHP